MRADRVEIAQQRGVPVGIGLVKILQDMLDHQLGLAVRIGRLICREGFLDRHACRLAVNCGGRAEHNVLAVIFF